MVDQDLRLKWKTGEKAKLARLCDISPSYLSDILVGRKRALPELASKIHAQATNMGLHLTRNDVMYPFESVNPLLNTSESGS